MMEIIGYIALIGIGVVLGALGGGGSVLSVPVLVYLFSMDMVTASAYSLFLVGTTSLVGAVLKQKEQLADVRAGIMFGIPSIIAAFCTRKWIIVAIPELIMEAGSFRLMKREMLLCLFALLMIASSVIMIMKWKSARPVAGRPGIANLIPAGVLVGLLAGLIGAGGGFLILPALVIFGGLPFRTAVGTTLFIIAFNSLLGFMGDLLNYSVNWFFLLPVTGLAVLGIFIGVRSDGVIPAHLLRRSFGWLTLLTGLCILVNELLCADV